MALQSFLEAGYVDVSHTRKPHLRHLWSKFLVNENRGSAVCLACLKVFNLDMRKGRMGISSAMSAHLAKADCAEAAHPRGQPQVELEVSRGRGDPKLRPDACLVLLPKVKAIDDLGLRWKAGQMTEDNLQKGPGSVSSTASSATDQSQDQSKLGMTDKVRLRECKAAGYLDISAAAANSEAWRKFLVNQSQKAAVCTHCWRGFRYDHYRLSSELPSFKENSNLVSSVSLLMTSLLVLANQGHFSCHEQGNRRD